MGGWSECGVVKTCGSLDAVGTSAPNRGKRSIDLAQVVSEDRESSQVVNNSAVAVNSATDEEVLSRQKRARSSVENQLLCSVAIAAFSTINWRITPPGRNDFADHNDNEYREAINLINNVFENGMSSFDRTRPGTIRQSSRVRIDLQQTFDRGDQIIANIQIQLNRPRRPGTSTTIAHVEIPIGVDFVTHRFLRRALIESLRSKVKVTMERNG